MSWSGSAIIRSCLTDALGNTQAFDLSGTPDTFKITLWTDAITPDKDAIETATRYNTGVWAAGANEVKETGPWPAGGIALVSPALTNPSSGVIMWDANDAASGSGADLANVFGTFTYDDTLVNDPGVCFNYLGGTNSITNGVFTVVFNANGLFRITV